MKASLGLALLAGMGLALYTPDGWAAEVSSTAKSACMMAINSQYGGNVRDLKVVRSEFSQANSEVIVKAIGLRGGSTNEKLRCLVFNSGKVQELRVLEN
ncbi:hypothetical protein [Cyanobium sp. ATX 6F1]|uniref:hypothetical protein n=1 Tax=unclassified Cyanobium TaxID=2627006 RepID=UPI0020CDD17A|nr:hypothetical protein [Cyanobium sp. ATX 6F1]MCP9915756.1 hypothetical protein [Cyanobium sp. ATX 6F1]